MTEGETSLKLTTGNFLTLLGMTGAMLIYGLALVWWTAGQHAEIIDHEKRLVRLEASDAKQGEIFAQISDRLARIEERLIALQSERTR